MWCKETFAYLIVGLSFSILLVSHPSFAAAPEVLTSVLTPVKPSGIIDDCCCEVEDVEEENESLFELLHGKLMKSTFFRIFKVNFVRDCPFWVEETVCSVQGPAGCSVCECEDEDIPLPWKIETFEHANTSTSSSLKGWEEDDKNVWISQDNYSKDTVYIDLLLNPETYTGYSGYNASKIWMAIYMENCFQQGRLDDMCLEERVFFRLISGLHGSITCHIAEQYFVDGEWQPNLPFYFARIGAWPDRIKNIYFTYAFLLRAASKAQTALIDYKYDTGNPQEDRQVRETVRALFKSPLLHDSCDSTFDETALFQQDHKAELRDQFREKFRNISRIMDCVACEKCKIHAKLQVLGIGTALKILLADSLDKVLQGLQRNEITALFNTLDKFSESVEIIQRMTEREGERRANQVIRVGLYLLGGFVVLGLSTCIQGDEPEARNREESEFVQHERDWLHANALHGSNRNNVSSTINGKKNGRKMNATNGATSTSTSTSDSDEPAVATTTIRRRVAPAARRAAVATKSSPKKRSTRSTSRSATPTRRSRRLSQTR